MPVPAGMRCPMMMFSLRPSRSSLAPRIAASVSTRVVSWNDAAEMNDCVVRLALVVKKSAKPATSEQQRLGRRGLGALLHHPLVDLAEGQPVPVLPLEAHGAARIDAPP